MLFDTSSLLSLAQVVAQTASPVATSAPESLDYFKMGMTLVGGLGFFLYGMTLLSQGLQAFGDTFIKRAINSIAANNFLAVIVGVVVTMLLQSSSVATVMVSGFLNAGLMTLTQGVGFVFGANIGTTITGWIIALQIGKYGLLFIGIGVLPIIFSQNQYVKSSGRLLLALGLIFFGLEYMSAAFAPLRTYQPFLDLMRYFAANSPLSILACMGIGCLLTMVIQSSSAMLGITMSLALEGAIGFPTAAALVLGENVGTTITLWLASLSGTRITKQIALAHTTFNITGSLLVFIVFPFYIAGILWLNSLLPQHFQTVGYKIAMVHSLFNVCMTLIACPFLNKLVQFVSWAIPVRTHNKDEKFEFFTNISSLSSLSPFLMLQQAHLVLRHLNTLTCEAVNLSREVLLSTDSQPEKRARIHEIEAKADQIQREIVVYLSKALQCETTESQAKEIHQCIHASDELESITDYCENLSRYRNRLDENNIILNRESQDILREFLTDVADFYEETTHWIEHPQKMDFARITARYQELNQVANAIRNQHLDMVQDQRYPPLFALTFSDIMVAIRRIKNHAMNLAETQVSGDAKF